MGAYAMVGACPVLYGIGNHMDQSAIIARQQENSRVLFDLL